MISPHVRRLRLGMELKALRDERNWTQTRMGRLAGITRNDISKLEHGATVDLAGVLTLLDALGVDGEQWTTLSELAYSAVTPGWWDSIRHIGERQALSANLESGAATIRAYEQTFLPGLLQLPEYTRSLHEARASRMSVSGTIEGDLAGRAGRQRTLRQPGGPLYEVIVDEIAILRPAAPDSTVKAQLQHLAQVARGSQANVTLRVLPAEVRIRDFAVPGTAFSIYTYPDPGDPTVVAVDTPTADMILTESAEISPYQWLYERLREAALSAEESASLLAKAADMLPGS